MGIDGLVRSAAAKLADFPASTRAVRRLSPRAAWVSALFHNIEATETPLTAGLGVTYSGDAFRRWLDACGDAYRFVSLDEISDIGRHNAAKRPLLITFDDAYASVARTAAPLLAERNISSVFFVNASLLDNRNLALDNLIAAIVNLVGMSPIERTARQRFSSVDDILSHHVARLNLTDRDAFRCSIQEASGISESDLLCRYSPYVTSQELALVPSLGMEIGNHTRSHVHCRVLDAAGIVSEIVGNQELLEGISRCPVRAFAYPYGRNEDATPASLAALYDSGHTTAFLVGGRLNAGTPGNSPHYRVSVKARSASEAVAELDWLPMLRTVKARRQRRAHD